MPNYRGEERSQSSYGNDLARRIEAGTTNRQRNRDLMQKIALGVVQAGLVGGAGLYHKSQSDAAQRAAQEPAKGAVGAALDNVYKKAPKQNQNWERDRDEAKLFRGETTSYPDYKPMAEQPDKLAQATLKDLDATLAGGQAPVHGSDGKPYWSPEQFNVADQEAEMHGRDINTARGIMKGTGIGASFRRY